MARFRILLFLLASLPTITAGAVQQPTTASVSQTPTETPLVLDLTHLEARTIKRLSARQFSKQEEDLFHLYFLEYVCTNLSGIGQAMHKSNLSFDGMLAMLDSTRIRTSEAGSLVGAHYESCYQLIRDYVHAVTVLELLQDTPARALADAGIIVANVGMIALDTVRKNYVAAAISASFLTAELMQAASWNTDKRAVVRLELERLDRRHSSAAQSLAAALRSSQVVNVNADHTKTNPFVRWAELRAKRRTLETAEEEEAVFIEFCQLLSSFPATDSTHHWRTALMLDALSVANSAAASRSSSSYGRGAMNERIRELSPIVIAIASEVCQTPLPDAREAGMIEMSRALAFTGRYGEAIKVLNLTQRVADEWYLSYRLAKLHSLAHDSRSSLDALLRSFALGYSDVQFVKIDPDMEWTRVNEASEFSKITTPVVQCSIDNGVLFCDLNIHNASHFELTNVKITGQVKHWAGNTEKLDYTIRQIGKNGDHEWGWAWGRSWEDTVHLSIVSDQGEVVLLMSK